MKLTKRQLYDYRDISRAELLLVKAIHHLWRLRRYFASTVHESEALDAAFETLFQAKREVKAEIKTKASESFKNSKLAWREEIMSQVRDRADFALRVSKAQSDR